LGITQGYKRSSSAERAGFGVASSLASTIVISRAVNYVRERQRPAPEARSRLRRLRNAPAGGGLRVHHFLPGVAIALASGGVAVVTRTGGSELRFSIPFGIGAGLTLDELALLIDVDNACGRSESLALAQAGLAAVTAAGLGFRFAKRSAAMEPQPQTGGDSPPA
jgi:hypothetical protein